MRLNNVDKGEGGSKGGGFRGKRRLKGRVQGEGGVIVGVRGG